MSEGYNDESLDRQAVARIWDNYVDDDKNPSVEEVRVQGDETGNHDVVVPGTVTINLSDREAYQIAYNLIRAVDANTARIAEMDQGVHPNAKQGGK